MNPSPRHVLVFDSGIGGLGVVNALRQMGDSGLRIDYLADNAVFPYGEQPDEILSARIISLIRAAIDAHQPDAVIIACNTASTLALGALRNALTVPFIGCVPPVRWAARESKTGIFAILATAATARRPYLAALKADFAPKDIMIIHGGRQLADLAERAFVGEAISQDAVRAELDAVFSQPHGDQVDVIGLGCTHYTFLREALQNASPLHVTLLDPAEAVARQALKILAEQPAHGKNAASETDMAGKGRFIMTAPPFDPAGLRRAIKRFGYEDFSVRDSGETSSAG
ncbi:glutamate racemase [Candidatus Kirkpatrickella diaphorinae]|uniref:Glutamate racemase n=1 Tax=Candidatus Kirkpatrickella diaphorinae TaxID=2984322 RepID=A0ABY6GKR2_9PROT|nr:glutamate racemase [Candidatus Kirkpatrickella diaphorinae]UYH52050.1 glutamate racemase [Candidatus Kirkpatrickella diaphorinae]